MSLSKCCPATCLNGKPCHGINLLPNGRCNYHQKNQYASTSKIRSEPDNESVNKLDDVTVVRYDKHVPAFNKYKMKQIECDNAKLISVRDNLQSDNQKLFVKIHDLELINQTLQHDLNEKTKVLTNVSELKMLLDKKSLELQQLKANHNRPQETCHILKQSRIKLEQLKPHNKTISEALELVYSTPRKTHWCLSFCICLIYYFLIVLISYIFVPFLGV